MTPNPKLPSLLPSQRSFIAAVRRAAEDYGRSCREAAAEPTGSSTRRNRLLDAHTHACTILATGRWLFRVTERDLATGPFNPAPIAMPGSESAQITDAVRSLRSILESLDDDAIEEAKSAVENLRARLCDTFGIPS